MSFSGFTKQLNKANQYVNEKIGGAQPTQPTQEFIELERKTDLTTQVIQQILEKTKELLYPNPTIRAKIAINSKIKGVNKEKYPHTEGEMADVMIKFGNLLGKVSILGQSLIEMGLTLKKTTEIKYSLEEKVTKELLEPINSFKLREIKDCLHHRKKLESRRLYYDSKKRKKMKGGSVLESDIQTAKDKYEESLNLATLAMKQLIDSESEQISQMTSLSRALYEYHSKCAEIYQSLTTRLNHKSEPKKTPDLNNVWDSAIDKTNAIVDPYKGFTGFIALNGQLTNGQRNAIKFVEKTSQIVSKSITECSTQKPISRCRALYDFNPQNDNELTLRKGEVIEVIQQIDDHWFEGRLREKVGFFPISYVEVIK